MPASSAEARVPLTDAELNMTPAEWSEAFTEDPSCFRTYLLAAIERGRAEERKTRDALADSVAELIGELSCVGDGPPRYDKCLRGLAGQPCPPCAKAIRAAAALRAAGRLP